MRKLLLLVGFTLIISFCAISCNDVEFAPIEKWGGGKYVVVHKLPSDEYQDYLRLKNPDTIFWVKVLKFDSERYNVGDTIR